MRGKNIQEIQVGDQARFSKTISESDIYLFAGITGDFNPAHVDRTFAENTFFKKRIAHGLLSAGLISTLLGTILPGPGTVYLSQGLNFRAPVYIGDTVTAKVEVVRLDVEKNRVILNTACMNQDGRVVLDGEACVLAPTEPGRTG